MALQITNIQKTSSKAKSHKVRASFEGTYLVTSNSGNIYRTRLNPLPSCTCDWAKYQPPGAPVACSHVQATLAWVEAQEGYTAKFYSTDEDVSSHKRRTIRLGNGVKATVRKAAASKVNELSSNELNDLLFG